MLDTPLLKATAQVQATHIKLISDLSDELDFLRSKYGAESYAYAKTLHRLERAERLFDEYERIFEAYLSYTTHLEIQNTTFEKLYKYVSQHSKGENVTAQNSSTTAGNKQGNRAKKRSPRPLKIGSDER